MSHREAGGQVGSDSTGTEGTQRPGKQQRSTGQSDRKQKI